MHKMVQEGPSNLLTVNPRGRYHNEKDLDRYKSSVEAVYITGLAEAHRQE